MTTLLDPLFCCPTCHSPLAEAPGALCCATCQREYPILNGIADFFVDEDGQTAADITNQLWLAAEVVNARDTIYRICTRNLKGMAFCMQEIRQRLQPGMRILEVGAGPGHFTRWIAETAAPDARVYAFDFSWPCLEKARINTQGVAGITLFRANARGPLPFPAECFDILFLRLAPLGPKGTPNIQAGYSWLKPGGWYFEAGWERENFETPPTAWALQHGYASAEYHTWQYERAQSEAERSAQRVEAGSTALWMPQPPPNTSGVKNSQTLTTMTIETLLIAQKPISSGGHHAY